MEPNTNHTDYQAHLEKPHKLSPGVYNKVRRILKKKGPIGAFELVRELRDKSLDFTDITQAVEEMCETGEVVTEKQNNQLMFSLSL